MYKIGNRLIEIHNSVLSELRQWNEQSRDDIEFDFPFGLSVYLSLVPSLSPVNMSLSDDAMVLVYGILN